MKIGAEILTHTTDSTHICQIAFRRATMKLYRSLEKKEKYYVTILRERI